MGDATATAGGSTSSGSSGLTAGVNDGWFGRVEWSSVDFATGGGFRQYGFRSRARGDNTSRHPSQLARGKGSQLFHESRDVLLGGEGSELGTPIFIVKR